MGLAGARRTIQDEPTAIAMVSTLGILAFVPFALRGTRLDTAMGVIVASALGFGAENIATKLLADDASLGAWIGVGIWFAVTVLVSVAAITIEMTALQRRPASIVVPVWFAVQTFLPLLLEPLYLAPQWSTMALYIAPLAIGLVLVAAGAPWPCAARGVSTLAAGG